MPLSGVYVAQVWLRDEAGNEAPASAVTVPLRFDNVAPGVAFAAGDPDLPETLRADISDVHSGPAKGEIYYRRLDTQQWTELPTKFQAGDSPDIAHLTARLPDLSPGTYVFRADAADAAGNAASSTRAPTAPRWRCARRRWLPR